MTEMQTRRVENATDQLIFLPPINGVERAEGDYVDFPRGMKLVPGLNTVPQLYLDALHERKLMLHDANGKPREGRDGKPLYRYPGREALAQLTAPVTYTTASGRRFGPRVIVHADALEGRADGPQAPEVLPGNEQTALAFIAATDDAKALQRWLTANGKQRPGLAIAIQARLAALRAGKAA